MIGLSDEVALWTEVDDDVVSEWLIEVASLLAEMADDVKLGLSCLFSVIDAVCEFVAVEAVEDDLSV